MGENTSINVDTRPETDVNQIAPNDKVGRVGGKTQDCQSQDVDDNRAPGRQDVAEPAWQGVPL